MRKEEDHFGGSKIQMRSPWMQETISEHTARGGAVQEFDDGAQEDAYWVCRIKY